jgi:hypothetical protein
MSKDTGGPAFPVTEWHLNGSTHSDWRGMTMRDYFAAKAMQGLMGRNWSNHKGSDEELIGVWARSSYAVADAMLKARGQE